jgi:hypothetical protein
VRCCCSRARSERRRDCDCSRCRFRRASTCRRESASARLDSIKGCNGAWEAGMAGCVVFGSLRRADWRFLSCSIWCRSEVLLSFRISGSQLFSMIGMDGCGGPCVCEKWLGLPSSSETSYCCCPGGGGGRGGPLVGVSDPDGLGGGTGGVEE